MSLHMTDVAHILVVLTLLMVFAHTFGQLFRVLRQPPVIGEILGGLLLGPSLLGVLRPGWEGHLFPHSGPTASVLGAVYQLGLVFMMFLAGGELRPPRSRSERRTVVGVTIMGLLVPFSVGIAVAMLFSPAPLIGPNGARTTFVLVFAIAIAVTSIPVVSRILLDLGLLGTAFARIVLTVAVLEDLALYVMLAVALGLAQSHSGAGFGLWAMTGVKSVPWSAAYYVIASVIFLAVMLLGGRTVFRWLAGQQFNTLERRSPTAFRLVFLFLAVLCCAALGINPVFGALMAGISVAQADGTSADPPGRPYDSSHWPSSCPSISHWWACNSTSCTISRSCSSSASSCWPASSSWQGCG
jgi:Kef-type K+ transport system membrane component KefB